MSLFENVKKNNAFTILSLIIGLFTMFLTTYFGKIVQGSTEELSNGQMMSYLVTSRPVYALGFTLFVLPLILKNELVKPI